MESLLAPLIGFSMVSITVSIFVTDDMSFKYTLCACTLSTDRRTVSTDVAGGIGMKYSLYTHVHSCISMERTIISINLADFSISSSQHQHGLSLDICTCI
jgi:hypothetical protein